MAEPTAPYPKYLDWLRYLSACLLFTYGLSKLLGIQFTLPPEMALRPVGSLTGRALAYVVLLQLFACSCEHSRTDATCKRLSFLCHCDVRPKVPVELIRGLLAMGKTGEGKTVDAKVRFLAALVKRNGNLQLQMKVKFA